MDKYQKFMSRFMTCICDGDCNIDKDISEVCYRHLSRAGRELKLFVEEQANIGKVNIDNEKLNKYITDKAIQKAIKKMSDDIYKLAKELEPPKPVKDSIADKFRQIIG